MHTCMVEITRPIEVHELREGLAPSRASVGLPHSNGELWLLLVLARAVHDVDAARHGAEVERDCEQHHRGASQRTHSNVKLLLCVAPEATEQHQRTCEPRTRFTTTRETMETVNVHRAWWFQL